MNLNTKIIIDYSLDITVGSLTAYVKMLDINAKLGIDILSHRSDKERYLMSVLFAFFLTDSVTKDLEQKEFNEAIEKIVNDFHDKIKKEESIKSKLFNSVKMSPIDALQTLMWFTKIRQDLLIKTFMTTTEHVMHLFSVRKISIVPNTEKDKQMIERGSKCKVDQDALLGLTNILNDINLRITNF